ncbi:MAG: ATP-binding protein [Motilibacteraceae bacterium]
MHLGDGAEAVREGRRYVERELVALGATALVDDAALVAAELLANAMQHGRPPVDLRVSGGPGRVRVEVSDADPRPPVQPSPSTTNMTGRGMALVQALAARWGATPQPDGGKVVWAELEPGTHRSADGDVEDLLAAWTEADAEDVGARRFPVELGDVPTDLLVAAKAHIDNLVREFSMLEGNETGAPLPAPLAELVDSVLHDFAAPRDAIKRQALAAAQRGEPLTHLSLRLPLSAADAGERYLRALDQADAYAREAQLLTLAAPEDHRRFRRWYVTELVAQLRGAAAGRPSAPAAPFHPEAHV